MNKEQILELLKEVKYPGFSRDIVSFGMVDKVEVSGKIVSVILKITSQQEEKKKAVLQNVKTVLEAANAFDSIEVSFTEGAPAATAPQPPGKPEQTSSLENVKHIIAVASGKGGVGKSTVAANLALALKATGRKVGLLDLDIYGPSLPIIFGINKQPQLTQEKKLIPIIQYDISVMSFGFISGNDTPVIWRGPMVSRMTEQFFRDVEWGELDYLVLDLPPGTGDIQLTLTQKLKLDGALMVTTPQDIALADVRKGADMFRKVQTPILGVIENMSGLHISGKITGNNESIKLDIAGESIPVDADGNFNFHLDIFKRGGGKNESERLQVPLLGVIPISKELMEATDSGYPLFLKDPDSPISLIFKDISNKVISAVEK